MPVPVSFIPQSKIAEEQKPEPIETLPRSMTKKELANYFGVGLRTINNWMDWLPHVKIGHVIRFNLEQVKKAAEKRFGQNMDSTPTRPGPSKSAMYRI